MKMKTQTLFALEQSKPAKSLLIHLLEDSVADAKLMELALEEVEISYSLEVIKDPEELVNSLDNKTHRVGLEGSLPIYLICRLPLKSAPPLPLKSTPVDRLFGCQ